MFLVKTYIAESTIPGAGLGCFAGEPIARDTQIWNYHEGLDICITPEQFSQLPPAIKEVLDDRAYMYRGKIYHCADNAQFMNHCTDERLNTYEFNDGTFAGRDIQHGEELLTNYYSFAATDEDRSFRFGWMDKV